MKLLTQKYFNLIPYYGSNVNIDLMNIEYNEIYRIHTFSVTSKAILRCSLSKTSKSLARRMAMMIAICLEFANILKFISISMTHATVLNSDNERNQINLHMINNPIRASIGHNQTRSRPRTEWYPRKILTDFKKHFINYYVHKHVSRRTVCYMHITQLIILFAGLVPRRSQYVKSTEQRLSTFGFWLISSPTVPSFKFGNGCVISSHTS